MLSSALYSSVVLVVGKVVQGHHTRGLSEQEV
jgi:hypothetical protein